jgi:hypothetical protein
MPLLSIIDVMLAINQSHNESEFKPHSIFLCQKVQVDDSESNLAEKRINIQERKFHFTIHRSKEYFCV